MTSYQVEAYQWRYQSFRDWSTTHTKARTDTAKKYGRYQPRDLKQRWYYINRVHGISWDLLKQHCPEVNTCTQNEKIRITGWVYD